MSVSQILEELPRLTPQERLRVAEEALALDALSTDEESLVRERLAEHDRAPETAVPLDDFLAQVQARYSL